MSPSHGRRHRGRALSRLGAAAAVVALLAGCVAPARSLDAYEGKAGASAEAALSAVRTAALAVDEAVAGRLPSAYASITIEDAERDAASVEGQFASIQPPDGASDRLRAQLAPMLSAAAGLLTLLRIAARRGDVDTLAARSSRLDDVAGRLASFGEAHT
jgi:hypothetical protein